MKELLKNCHHYKKSRIILFCPMQDLPILQPKCKQTLSYQLQISEQLLQPFRG